jgi:hypothetical protein
MRPWDWTPGKYLHPIREQHYHRHEENGRKVPSPGSGSAAMEYLPAEPGYGAATFSPRAAYRCRQYRADSCLQCADGELVGQTDVCAKNWISGYPAS